MLGQEQPHVGPSWPGSRLAVSSAPTLCSWGQCLGVPWGSCAGEEPFQAAPPVPLQGRIFLLLLCPRRMSVEHGEGFGWDRGALLQPSGVWRGCAWGDPAQPSPAHTWGQGSLESFQLRRSCPGRSTEVSPLMCAGKTPLAPSQSRGSRSLAATAALPASPAGPWHVEPPWAIPSGSGAEGERWPRGQQDSGHTLAPGSRGCVSPGGSGAAPGAPPLK